MDSYYESAVTRFLKKHLIYKCFSVLNELKCKYYPGMVACAFHHSSWESEREFEASLSYVVTSSPARNAQQDPVSKLKKDKIK